MGAQSTMSGHRRQALQRPFNHRVLMDVRPTMPQAEGAEASPLRFAALSTALTAFRQAFRFSRPGARFSASRIRPSSPANPYPRVKFRPRNAVNNDHLTLCRSYVGNRTDHIPPVECQRHSLAAIHLPPTEPDAHDSRRWQSNIRRTRQRPGVSPGPSRSNAPQTVHSVLTPTGAPAGLFTAPGERGGS